MPDREKVIKGLECCRDLDLTDMGCPDACPYYDDSNECGCCLYTPLMNDAIALLREQEPIAPTETEDGDMLCGNCGETVGWEELSCGGISMDKYKYCPNCGRKVKWDAAD